MTAPSARDRTPQLRHLMQQANLPSFKALSQASGVSEKQIRHLRQGDWATLRLDTVIQVSRVLQVTLEEFIATLTGQETEGRGQEAEGEGQERQRSGVFSLSHPDSERDSSQSEAVSHLSELRQEYDRLQVKLAHQREELWQEFQQSSVQVLESLLLQLPTALYAAQQNPQAPAVKLIPLLRPIDGLLQHWGIEAIANVGAEVAYDPQHHQLMEGTAAPGDSVRVRYTGYRQGEKLLYRAKVSPLH